MKPGLGCTLGGRSYCALFYADDIILLSGSVSKMQKMLNICNEYGKKYAINFNERKTKWFCTDVYGKSRLVTFVMNDILLENDGKIIKFF